MKNNKMLGAALLAGVLSFCACGCQAPNAPGPAPGVEVNVESDPPAPLAEVVSPSPGSDYVWIGGSWSWQNHWVWESGRWERPPFAGAVYVPHRYVDHNGKHVFVRGGWR